MSLRCYGPSLYGWGRHQPRWNFDFNGHALVCGDEADTVLVVDPFEPTPRELAAVRALGDRFEVILLNADHERAAAQVSRALEARVWTPRADAHLLTVPPTPYEDGHEFPGGWRIIALADLKTPGESVLYHERRRVLVVGDAVVGDPVNGMRLVPPMKIPDHDLAMKSVARLCELEVDALLLSDGYCLARGGGAVLKAFAAS